jgi:tRNA(Ile)-lysidine synthase
MVSGGQDSVALLHLLATGGLGAAGPSRVRVLHVNHGLRGAESEADQELVRTHCERLGVSLEVRRLGLERAAGNLQERARDLRREAGREVATRRGIARIALGHTLDDQVETLLYRIARYAGLRALAGMLPLDPPWARPLLECRRAETEAYCREHALDFAVDRGNLYPGYARTDLRHSVLPAWEAALPGAVGAAGRTASVAAELLAAVEALVDEAEEDARPHLPDAPVSWSSLRLLAQPPALRRALLHRLLSRLEGVEAGRALVAALDSLLVSPGTAELSLGAGWSAEQSYGRLRFLPKASAETGAGGEGTMDGGPPTARPLASGGRVSWGPYSLVAQEVEAFSAPDVRREAFVDGDRVEWPLVVRARLPGDRFHPLGASGSRPLKEVFIDLKVPARLRSWVPLVVSGERVLWVGGYALAREGRITSATERVVRLAIEEGVDARDEDPYQHR